jgi:hypothetical protein
MASVTMRIDNKVIETRWFPDSHLLIKGYLQGLKQDLLEQNDDIIQLSNSAPEFEVQATPKQIIRN